MAAKGPESSEEIRRKHPGLQHKLVLIDRESMIVDGVMNVESFDDEEILLETNAGILTVTGHDLHIKQLNLEDGNIEIDGYVESCDYTDENPKKTRGLFARLLR
ncbi:MAG: sporulation protein YabP [Clostridia bacterium]|nr:sporulation protein YabP [Clostridia bacterium]